MSSYSTDTSSDEGDPSFTSRDYGENISSDSDVSLHNLSHRRNTITTNSSNDNITRSGRSLINIGQREAVYKDELIREGGHMNKRQRQEYIILTKKSALGFKNYKRASEYFNTLAGHETLLLPAKYVLFEFDDVLAVHELNSDRLRIQIDYERQNPSDETRALHHVTFTANDVNKHRKCLKKLRDMIPRNPRAITLLPYHRESVSDILLSQVELPERSKFMAYRVVLLKKTKNKLIAANKTHEESQVVILALGKNNLFIIPYWESDPSDASKNFNHQEQTIGLLSISHILLEGLDDTLQLIVRKPFEEPHVVYVSSSACELIAREIQMAVESLTPWYKQPLCQIHSVFTIRSGSQPNDTTSDGGFLRLLEAFCKSYGVNRERLSVNVELIVSQNASRTVDNLATNPDLNNGIEPANGILRSISPGIRITIFAPNVEKGLTGSSEYTAIELLAILRAMRYNPLIHEIVFRCSIASLETFDPYSVRPIDQLSDVQFDQSQSVNEIAAKNLNVSTEQLNLLLIELYSLLSESSTLIKLDLSNCNLRGEGVLSAIGAALKSETTGIEMLHLGGNQMSHRDVLLLIEGIQVHNKPIKVLDLSSNRLHKDTVKLVLDNLLTRFPQELELLDLTGNCLNIGKDYLNSIFTKFQSIRVLRLGDWPGFTLNLPKIDLKTITELVFSGTEMSQKSVLTLVEYINNTDMSSNLEILSLESCNLSSENISKLLEAMEHNNRRDIRLLVGGNQIALDFDKFSNCVAHNQTPRWLGLSHVQWNESQLCTFLKSLCANREITVLDISFPKLACDIDDETANLFKKVLAENHILLALNLAGGGEGTRFGPKLGKVLDGLKKNKTLQKLDLTGNCFGDEGAEKLSDSLYVNTSLREIGIDDNSIEGVGFVKLSASISANKTIVHMPKPVKDLAAYYTALQTELQKITRELSTAEYASKADNLFKRRKSKEQLKVHRQGKQATEQLIKKTEESMKNMLNKINKNRKAMKRSTVNAQQQSSSISPTTIDKVNVNGKSWGYFKTEISVNSDASLDNLKFVVRDLSHLRII
ncbi:12887_t:CDS:2 [Ambispora leptoticha]|uniref:12887_t:CDS:1 n=1 Tax=Ambispora leptoticha TaxID=144679 RepID=A0A9N8Z725_9GLOM|nr:12887_t:CDS:2 [Ambispora leptoticha]